MVEIVLPNNHITFTAAESIREICRPLVRLNINSFNFIKSYPDGTQIKLSDNASWQEHIFLHELYNISPFTNHPKAFRGGLYLWSCLDGQAMFRDAREYFDLDHGVTMVRKMRDGSCEFYCFSGARNNPSIVHFFINNVDVLQRFVLYFKEQAKYIIREAEKNRIVIPSNTKQQDELKFFIDNGTKRDFLRATKIDKFTFEKHEPNSTAISGRELDCLLCLLSNYSAQETSEILFLSRRTVETHLENLKMKLDCKNKSELKKLFAKQDINYFKDALLV